MSHNKITAKDLDHYLFEVAKEYYKLGKKKVSSDIIIVGGASVLLNYDFRDISEDADAILNAQSFLKDAIRKVAKKFDLPDDWLNSDFIKTVSFSNKLEKYSKYYKTYANSINVRTINREYLIAMKLSSFRLYKNDLSDIIGILKSEYDKGTPVSLKEITDAITNLYGSYFYISKSARDFIENIINNNKYLSMYEEVRNNELHNRSIVVSNIANIKNESDISYVISLVNNKELMKLYESFNIKLSTDMQKNAFNVQSCINKHCSLHSINKDAYTKEIFGDLYDLHISYLNNF